MPIYFNELFDFDKHGENVGSWCSKLKAPCYVEEGDECPLYNDECDDNDPELIITSNGFCVLDPLEFGTKDDPNWERLAHTLKELLDE